MARRTETLYAFRVKLRFVIVGRDRNDPVVEASNDYFQRIQRYTSAELVELKEAPLRRGESVERVKSVEADRIRDALRPEDRWVMMDERGRAMTSPEWAHRFEAWMNEGQKGVSFVIGGPSGLHPDLLRAGHERWTLSKLTLPHRVARLVLFEQVYRAFTILHKTPYHK